MKKWMLLLLVPVLVLGIVGCTGDINEVTVVDIIEKTLEASQNVKSQHMVLTMDQVFTMGGEEGVETTTIFESDIINDPMSMYLKTTNDEYDMSLEMYVTPDGNYLKNIDSDNWLIIDDELANITISDTQNKSATEIIERFKDFPADFTLEDKDGSYLLSINASDEKFKELIKDQLAGNMPEDFDVDQLMDSIKINTIKYSISIDKETYLTKEMYMDMDFEISLMGMTLNMEQRAKGEFSKYNEVEEIVVPKEVKQNAKPTE